MRTALVVGGGIGGITVANSLRALLPRDDRILLIERNPIHQFQPSLLWIISGTRSPQQIRRPLSRLLRRGVELIAAEAQTIDPLHRTVTAGEHSYSGDVLILALGADLAPSAVPGLAEVGFNLYDAAGAVGLHRALASDKGGRIVILTAEPLFKCPPAPYEAALLIDNFLRRHKKRDAYTLEFRAAEPMPMAIAGAHISSAVRELLDSRGIAYYPNMQIASVDSHNRTIRFASGDSTGYDVLAYVPPHRAPGILGPTGLLSESGWAGIARDTFQTKVPGVYAIGDVATIPLPIGKPLPKAGVFAHAQGRVLARRIAAQWNEKRSAAQFDGHGACFLELGGNKAAMATGNFYAEPVPQIAMRKPAIAWHIAKVLFEQWWLRGGARFWT